MSTTSEQELPKELYRALTVLGLADYGHVGLVRDHGSQSVAHHGMVIGDKDTDLGVVHVIPLPPALRWWRMSIHTRTDYAAAATREAFA